MDEYQPRRDLAFRPAEHKPSAPASLHPALQWLMGLCALSLTAAALSFAVTTARQERNAQLVGIGVTILRADPNKESQTIPAREWALDLIDANAGGVKFSREAREALKLHPLPSLVISELDRENPNPP